jgi:hypothetical protein
MVFNNYRVDFRAQMVNQEPFAIIYHTTGVGSVGMFVHHGDWPELSFLPPASLWTSIDRYGIGDFFLAQPVGGKTSGSLDKLSGGDQSAFFAVVDLIRRSPPVL